MAFDFGHSLGNFASTRGLIGGLFDESGDRGIDRLDHNANLYSSIGLPSDKWTDVDPNLVNTESANYALTTDDPVMKSRQLEALASMKNLSETGSSPQDDLGFFRARELGDQMAKASSGAAQESAQARGVAGSGSELMAREIANQEAARRAQEAALTQAASSATNRNAYLNAYAGQVGQARNQDYQTNKGNSDVINQFNMANTNTRNAASNTNTAAKNDMAKYNNNGRLGLAQQNFDNAMTRTRGEVDANNQLARGYFAQNAANQNARNQDTSALTSGMMMGM